ncbi:glutamate-5-semialdehyde dehydrogenase [Sphingomonas lenta]|uniref:Gamma-glutamyl phosphate reductase n=1 Tax=Sphingomonas lenta TaxID=1141887 RepID=A0A2A2SCB7_9SPHN|nr:glutamate-5-semialdehyde dehydrogenase [Sphingomonas lenta]PAX06822.1 glutamate-5-semialdehyde dehydrogenase [Sphingomonas lenta]
MGRAAREAAAMLAQTDTAAKAAALRGAAGRVRERAGAILAANEADMARAAAAGLTGAMLDRLRLDNARLAGIAAGLEAVAALPDPVGQVIGEWTRPNGLRFTQVRVPLGVVGIIYESRPNVTADAAALCLMSGNACILRGGAEAIETNRALHAAVVEGLADAGITPDAVQLVPTTDRAAVGAILRARGLIDVVIPRGGKSLVARVEEEARVPVLAHLDGVCHVYFDRSADPAKARAVALNSKMRRTGVCGAAETLLIDEVLPVETTRAVLGDLLDAGCELRVAPDLLALDPRLVPASPEDWGTEYLDAIMAVATVPGVAGAIEHIARYGSHHTDAIVAEDDRAAERFLTEVDSAIVLHNASTQFADGGEFGFGAEIGIATGRLHARGPVGLAGLTTYKTVVRGDGQVRAP